MKQITTLYPSYMRAHVLLNLLQKLGKRDFMCAIFEVYSMFWETMLIIFVRVLNNISSLL